MKMKIKRRDGSIVEVEGTYTLNDGESIVGTFLQFMDRELDDEVQRATRAAMDADLNAEMALHRPGFRYGDGGAASARACEARDQWIDHVTNAWRPPRTRAERRERQREAPDPSDERALRDAADEARRQYAERTCNAWKQTLGSK